MKDSNKASIKTPTRNVDDVSIRNMTKGINEERRE